MRRGEGTAGGRAGGETRESSGREGVKRLEPWAGQERQGQEEGRGHSSGVGIYLEGWGGSVVIHSRIHPQVPCSWEEHDAAVMNGVHIPAPLPAYWLCGLV